MNKGNTAEVIKEYARIKESVQLWNNTDKEGCQLFFRLFRDACGFEKGFLTDREIHMRDTYIIMRSCMPKRVRMQVEFDDKKS